MKQSILCSVCNKHFKTNNKRVKTCSSVCSRKYSLLAKQKPKNLPLIPYYSVKNIPPDLFESPFEKDSWCLIHQVDHWPCKMCEENKP